MIEKKNIVVEVAFDYANGAGSCSATGNYTVVNGEVKTVGINGHYTKGGETYNFTANRDDQGNVNISGVAPAVLPDVAAEVAEIVAEVEAEVAPANTED